MRVAWQSRLQKFVALYGCQELVLWHTYNFLAGNFYDPQTNSSPQDETTAELLNAEVVPMPNLVFSPHFLVEALKGWTNRQVYMFSARGQQLHA